MKTDLERLALNAKLGDGCIAPQGASYGMNFVSTSLDYLLYKQLLGVKAGASRIRTQKSGYSGKKVIYVFNVHNTVEAAAAHKMSYTEAIADLDSLDLIMWILDDGSVHKRAGTIHLYSNMLSDIESLHLAEKIFQMYPVAKPSVRVDRKKDGRKFNYIYIPRLTAEAIQKDMEIFLNNNGIQSLLYKSVRKYTLNDHRTAGVGRPPAIGPATLEPSRVEPAGSKQEGRVLRTA